MSELHEMTADNLADFFSMLPGWEEKFRYIIDLGQKLPPFPEEYKKDEYRIFGCQSLVWLKSDYNDGRIHFIADADAAIVRGLIAILMVIYNHKSAEEILGFDIHAWLESVGLSSQLTPTRSNGLHAMVKRLHAFAEQAHSGH